MAKTLFPVEVLTPEGEVFSGDVMQVTTRTGLGSLGILAKHQPLLATLDPAELRLHRSEDEVISFVQGEGYLQVQRDSRVLILIDEVARVEDIDRAEWEGRLKRAGEELAAAEDGSHQAATAKRDQRRAEAVLAVLDKR